jgi:hypothetical protein
MTTVKVSPQRLLLSLWLLINEQAGVYILENTLPPGGGKYQPMSFGGKNMKRRREKGGKCKRKRNKGKRKRKKGKENEKRGSKRVK